MKLWLLPFLRDGVTPTAAGGARAQVSIHLRLESPGRTPRDVQRAVVLTGPGDVLSIEPRQLLRVSPKAGTRDAEPEFFPLIEFDAPDLPWAYSPSLPSGNHLVPWITLIVLEADERLRLVRGAEGQSPWILHLPADRARRELPNLADAWAWAHAQVACATSGQIAATLASQPDRTLSRLLAPRRLLPGRSYVAAVVPTFLSGRIAGLGENPNHHPALVTGQEHAWSPSDIPDRLPAYHAWTFQTGPAGDFESLAQRLRPVQLDPKAEVIPLELSLPGGVAAPAVEWEAPLRVPGRVPTKPRRPAAAINEIRKALRPSTRPPVFGPSYFGLPWSTERALTPLTSWAPQLNLTPALRAAAGLGADAVRAEQDALVAAAKQQLDDFKQTQRDSRRRQLAIAFVNRVVQRLATAPPAEQARVNAPLAARAQTGASDYGLYTLAGRRLARKTGSPALKARAGVTTIGTLSPGVAIPSNDLVLAELSDKLPPIELTPIVVRSPLNPSPPDTPSDGTAVPSGAFAPSFSRPMSEPLAERFPELMLPGLGSVPPEGAALVESNPEFIEAFLLGASQELSYELLWRGLPSDFRAAAFRMFWGHTRDAVDMSDPRTWKADDTLGSHIASAASMVLLIRSELVRRYPSLLVALVPAVWGNNDSRSPGATSSMVLPAFRGRIGEDVLYVGFSGPTPKETIGSSKKSDAKPGWFFVLGENQADPRFGLDPDGGTTPPTRATLSWVQLALPPDAATATLAAFPLVPDANFNPGTATSATLANLVRQRPFRAFLHASLLVQPKS